MTGKDVGNCVDRCSSVESPDKAIKATKETLFNGLGRIERGVRT